jgi:hypothetical protein
MKIFGTYCSPAGKVRFKREESQKVRMGRMKIGEKCRACLGLVRPGYGGAEDIRVPRW